MDSKLVALLARPIFADGFAGHWRCD